MKVRLPPLVIVEIALFVVLLASIGWRIAGDRARGQEEPPAPAASLETLLHDANAAYERSDISRAAALYTDILKKDPKNIPARIRLANIFHQNSWNNNATVYLDEVFALDPMNVEAHLLRAKIRRNEGESNLSTQDYLQVLTVQPNNPEALYYLGTTYQTSQRLNDAINAYRRAIVADAALAKPLFEDVPFGIQARLQLGRTYRQLATAALRDNNAQEGMTFIETSLAELREALNMARRAKQAGFYEAQAELTNALRQKAAVFRRYGQPNDPRALACYEEILKTDPEDTDAWMEAGQIYYRTAKTRADLEKALSYFQQAYQLDPRDIDALANLTSVKQDLARPDLGLSAN